MRGIKNVFYCVTHSPAVLGSMAAVLFTVALFLGLGHHGTQGRALLYDSRGTVLCAFAIAAAVVVYEGENRIPTAAVSRGNGRAAFYLSRILACHLLTACIYGLSVCGAAGWLKRPLTKEFFVGLAATLPFCGFKHGRWLGIHWYEKRLCPPDPPKARPVPASQTDWTGLELTVGELCEIELN